MVTTQSGIVVTGAAVRLTGSGLGCSTWPECTPGSYTPTPDQPEAPIHAWIEFGNRLLTFLLLLNAIALFAMIIRLRATHLRRLGLVQVLGILAQAVLGGITVLTGLNPLTVAGHFLLSIVLIAAALSLRQRIHGHTPTVTKLSPITLRLSRIALALTVLVIAMGTIVTGSGPHAGDSMAQRFDLDAKTMSWLHADLVIALIGITIALLISTRLGESAEIDQFWGRKVKIFLAVVFAQGAIGYIQYFTGLPELIVGFHILGAVVVWIAAWNFAITGNVAGKGVGREE